MTPRDLLPVVHDELPKLGAVKLAAESPGHILDATASVHDAWLKLAGASIDWQDRTHVCLLGQFRCRRFGGAVSLLTSRYPLI